MGEERTAEFDLEPGPMGWLVDLWRQTDQVRVEFTMAGSAILGLRWTDIMAWVEGAGEHDLAPLYREGIRLLSAAYAETAMAAREVDCEAPWDPGKV